MFDTPPGPRKRIAIVGAGISGLSAAYYLSPEHDVTLFEADTRLGGHARTVLAGRKGDQPVDTGFIVFNYATYPRLTRLFQQLDVPVIKSDMSFCATVDDGRVEYGLSNLRALLAQKSNLARPQFYRMIADIFRFGRNADDVIDDDMTIGQMIERFGFGSWFRDCYLLPMCGAIWSTPAREIDRFPARSVLRFFRNHALLAGTPSHQWWTVKGGSIEYVRRLETALRARGTAIRTGAPVAAIRRDDKGVSLTSHGLAERFDEVILACHSDQALAILGDQASPVERQALGAIRYQTNTAVLHADPSQMPKRRACWASWAYRAQDGAVGVTYWMNLLQSIPQEDPLFVTLNPSSDIAADAVYDRVTYAHPVFDGAALAAQDTLRNLQGQNHTWFAGAYNRHGFHEDGIASALRVVRGLQAGHFLKGSEDAFDGQGAEGGIPDDLRAPA